MQVYARGTRHEGVTFAGLAPLWCESAFGFAVLIHFRRFRPEARVTFAYYPPVDASGVVRAL
eukprot:2251741-Prymnesium_polylepis.1